MEIVLSNNETYVLYLIIYIGSLLILWGADHIFSRQVSYLLYLIVSIVLGLIICCRDVGIDRDTYLTIYQETPLYLENYAASSFQEPLYFLLNIIAYYVFNNYKFIQFFQGIIFAGASFELLKFCRSKKISTAICYSFYLATIFFYLMGLNRMAIAVNCLTIGILKYFKNKRGFRFIITCVCASLFHYSALIVSVLFIYLFVLKKNKQINYVILKIGCVLPVAGFIALKMASAMLLSILPEKYKGYLTNITFNISYLKNIIYILPLFIIYIYFEANKILKREDEKRVISKTMAIILFFTIFTMFFDGAFRFTFYFNFLIAFLYAFYLKKVRIFAYDCKVLIGIGYVIILLLYAVVVFFDSIYITNFIVPFRGTF